MVDNWGSIFAEDFDVKVTETEFFWTHLFDTNTSCFYDLLYDLVAFQKGQLGRGRRKAMDASMEDLFRAVYGDNS